ncbi:MAG: STAS domain-containing protein [Spirochaetes bacterium]|nr:STAS domain-containing protein [Spirochaetota bacterium]
MAAEINYSIEEREGAKIVNLAGVLCSATEREFTSLIESLIATNNVIINLSGVSMVTSSGLKALTDLSYLARQRKRRIMILGVSENLQNLINATESYDLILIHSVEEGIRKLEYYI